MIRSRRVSLSLRLARWPCGGHPAARKRPRRAIPTGPIRVIVGSRRPAGNDIFARLVGQIALRHPQAARHHRDKPGRRPISADMFAGHGRPYTLIRRLRHDVDRAGALRGSPYHSDENLRAALHIAASR